MLRELKQASAKRMQKIVDDGNFDDALYACVAEEIDSWNRQITETYESSKCVNRS